MKKFSFLIITINVILFGVQRSTAQTATEDTTIIQCFTYQSPQDAWFNFPSDTNHYRKILMMYNLHCPDPVQCGEWDYLTYTYLYDHTGVQDSTLLNHSSFTVDGNSPDSVSYLNSPSYSYQASLQYSLVIDSTLSSNLFSIGNGTQQSVHPFNTLADTRSRTVYLWKASELTAAGLTAGNISSIALNAVFSWSTELNHLKIRMASTALDSLTDNQLSATWFSVFNHNTYLSTGSNILQFTQSYLWDGISNLMIEFSYDNDETGWDNLIETTPETWSAGITSTGNDKDIFFDGAEFVQVPKEAFAAIDSFVTIAYWAYGDPATQPNDGTCFEAVGADGHRILNAHCPWSNLNIYWDAGSDGVNYDRINYAGTAQQTEGQWNYWTFTKNCATGSMKIYLNGTLWNSATGLTKRMNGIEYFRIGKGIWNGAQSYRGAMDEFAVWNVELDAATIQQYMYKDIDALHPFYANLMCYYNFDSSVNYTFADGSLGNYTATIMSNLDNQFVPAQTLFRNYGKLYERPNIVFEQGTFVSHLDSLVVVDTIENAPFTIVMYGDTLNPTTATDTIYVWANYFNNYLYDVAGNAIDSSFVIADDTLWKQTWYYYSDAFEVIDRYELARFITLYGNPPTTLGPTGKTWVYDLTNLAPLLHDSVHLSAGNWQEWLDMKFIMIKGTPARDPVSVVNLWNGDYGHNSSMETYLHPLRLKIENNAMNTMWRTINTGHGQNGQPVEACDEFCQNSQYGKVNGVQHFNQLVWRDDCSKNPLYPQMGTWIYSRANWCPGADVREYDWELTPFVTPGDSVTLDLDMDPPGVNNGNYVISSQLISFGLPNFSVDAEVYDIVSPSNQFIYSRMNPICASPVIKIKNGGTSPLTSATISYGVVGGTTYTYNWTGNLLFLQTETVTLPSPWISDGNKFRATISNPNGVIDENENNNSATSTFVPTAFYSTGNSNPAKLVLEVKTNDNGFENSYSIKDVDGNVLVNRTNLLSQTVYRDTFPVNNYNCYTFQILDTDDDGLTFWNPLVEGSGYARLRRADALNILKNFQTEFGSELTHQFTVNWALDAPNIKSSEVSFSVFPNPTVNDLIVSFESSQPTEFIEAVITDLSGKVLKTQRSEFASFVDLTFDVNDLEVGVYLVVLKSGNRKFTSKFIKLKD